MLFSIFILLSSDHDHNGVKHPYMFLCMVVKAVITNRFAFLAAWVWRTLTYTEKVTRCIQPNGWLSSERALNWNWIEAIH